MIKELRAALQFLTILPLGKPVDFPGYRMVPYFPLAGVIIGLLLALIDAALQHIFPLSIVSLIDVVFLAVVTGALHLDGLADTADGLFSHRNSEDVLKIMKDSRIGAMGLLALIFVLGIKWAGIFCLHENRAYNLIIITAYARGAFSIAIHFLGYIRPEGGTASAFFGGDKSIVSLGWLLAPVALSLLLGLKGVLLTGSFIGVVVLVMLYYKKRLGGITGDMLGALGEVTEAGLFLFAATGFDGA
jgi:adenosylcobinamide-GDP ribazoletransferase